jgi:MFS family permease
MHDIPANQPLSTSRSPRLAVRYLVLGWFCVAAALAYGPRPLLGLCATLVQEELSLSDEAFGWALGAFFLSYSLFQIPAGWLAGRWGSRVALAVSMAGCSLAATLTSAASGLTSLMSWRLGTGVFQAGIFPACTSSFGQWFPRTERAVSSGLLTGFMSAGGAAAVALGGWLLKHNYVGWRGAFVLAGVPGIFWSLGFYWWFRNRPAEHSSVSPAELAKIRAGTTTEDDGESTSDERPQHEPTPWRALLTSVPLWLISTQQFFRAAGYALFLSWFPKYLQKVYESSVEEAGALTSIALVAVTVGSPIGGVWSDWLLARTGSRGLSRKWLSVVTMLACAAFFLAAGFATNARMALVLFTGAAFFGSIAGPAAYAITIDMGGRHVPTVFSIMNMGGNIGATVFPIVVGTLIEWTGSWTWIPAFVAGIYIAGALFWLGLNTRGTVFDQKAAAA